MLTTFITTLKVLVRDRTVLLWAIAFPLVLATLFHVMFSTLDESYKLDPIPLVIVQDAHYSEAESFSELIDALAADDANDGSPLLLPTFVADEEAALGALKEGNYQGYIQLDADGTPSYHRDARRTDSLGAPNQSIISSLLDRYVQDVDLITRIAEENPQLLAGPDFLDSGLRAISPAWNL